MDQKSRVYLSLVILVIGIGGIYIINNTLPLIDTQTWVYRNPVIIPAYSPVGGDFREGLYKSAEILFFGAHYSGGLIDRLYPSIYPPLVNYLGLPFILFNENTAYLIFIGLLVLINILSLLLAVFMTRRYWFVDLGIGEVFEVLISFFIFFTLLFFTLSSYPFLFSIERGNYDIIAIFFAFLSVFWLLKHPNHIWVHVILLSIATHLKIYPAILFTVLFYKHRSKVIVPAVLVNLVFLFLLGSQNAWGFFQGITYTAGTDHVLTWVGNHSAISFARLILNNFQTVQPYSLFLFWGIFSLIPIIFWLVAAKNIFFQKYSECNALLMVMVSIPLMNIIPSISHDYKLVILNPAIIFLIALIIRKIIINSNLADFIQLELVMIILLFIGRSYYLFSPSLLFFGNKYLWTLGLELIMVINIINFPNIRVISNDIVTKGYSPKL